MRFWVFGKTILKWDDIGGVWLVFQLGRELSGRVAPGAVLVLPGVGCDFRKTDAGHVRFSKSRIVMRALAFVKVCGRHESAPKEPSG